MNIETQVQRAIPELEKQAKADGIEKKVVGAILTFQKQILIVMRSDKEDFLPGLAEIPSGGVDGNETIMEALQREVFEETGLKILSVQKYLNSFDYMTGSGKKARQYNFWVIPESKDVKLNPEEHSRYEWWDSQKKETFEAYNFSNETRKAINDAVRQIFMELNE